VNPLSLYPAVELPVSPTTPMLSSLVVWDHSRSWAVPTVDEFLSRTSGGPGTGNSSSVEVDLSDSEHAYLSDHVIDGRILFPATGYLVLAWQHFARMNGHSYQQTPVRFDDVHILRATILPSDGKRPLITLIKASVAVRRAHSYFWCPRIKQTIRNMCRLCLPLK